MTVAGAGATDSFAELHLKASVLERYGLPDVGYPVPSDVLLTSIIEADDLQLPLLLYGMQLRSRDGTANWRELEPVLDRLATLIAPDSAPSVIRAGGDAWWLEIGVVDLSCEIVTIQRGSELIAAIRPRHDGTLRVAAYRPLDGKSARYLMGLGMRPGRGGQVCLRENNWEYALDCSATLGNFHAADAGESYLSYWEFGLGLDRERNEVPQWKSQQGLQPRVAAIVATELGVHHSL